MTKRLVNPAGLYDGSPIGLSHGTIDEESGLLCISGQVAWDLEQLISESTVAGQRIRIGNITAHFGGRERHREASPYHPGPMTPEFHRIAAPTPRSERFLPQDIDLRAALRA